MIPDTHAHLDMIEQDTGSVLERARAAGVGPVLTIGINIGSTLEAIRISANHEGVFASAGIHPNDTRGVTAEDMDRLAELAGGDSVVAIGETGLDYYRDTSTPGEQKEVFRCQVRLARRLGKALIVHDREAHADALALLGEEKAGEVPVVMHCFSGDGGVLAECLSRGYYISFAGPVTFKNAASARQAAAAVPLERLLAETDAPFLSPEPYRGKFPNLPERVVLVADELARLRGLASQEMARVLTENASRVFGIPLTEGGPG